MTDSVKETRQQKELGVGVGGQRQRVRGGGGQNLKKWGVGNIGGVFKKQGCQEPYGNYGINITKQM